MLALDLLAANNFGDTRSGGLAGPMGLFIIVLLAIVTVLLIRNMTARIRRLPAEFPDQDGKSAGQATATPMKPLDDTTPAKEELPPAP